MINTLVWRRKQILTAVDATFTCSHLTPPANVAGANTNSWQVEWVKGRDARFRPKRKVRTVSLARILMEWEYNEAVHQLFIDFKKAYDSVRRGVLYNTLIEFGVPKKLLRLIKMCLTETYSRVRVGKNLSDMFPIRNGLKQGDALSLLTFQLCFGVCH